MSNFSIYMVGFVIVIIGLAWLAFSMGVAPLWIAIGAVILIGLAMLSGVSKTRQKEPPSE